MPVVYHLLTKCMDRVRPLLDQPVHFVRFFHGHGMGGTFNDHHFRAGDSVRKILREFDRGHLIFRTDDDQGRRSYIMQPVHDVELVAAQ